MRNVSSETGTIVTARPRHSSHYIGRFAPSPTGPLHFGSLLAAVASYLEARSRDGQWHLRVEDIDPPREQAGATDQILFALECFGFEWDGEITFQSDSHEAHHAAIQKLRSAGLAYPCNCSRRQLRNVPQGPLGPIYPGTCRNGCDGDEFATRVRTTSDPVTFHDRLQGPCSHSLEPESGDFVIHRRDGLVAYQLAVVVDDHLQGITDVVRGIDLMDSTPRQIWLQTLLGYTTPSYCHLPVAINELGQKLSKSHGAQGIPLGDPAELLKIALDTLRQQPPERLAEQGLSGVWEWALDNWDISVLEGVATIDVSGFEWA